MNGGEYERRCEALLWYCWEYRSDLHGQCDFIVKNFDLRKSARTTEIEAIADAKAILSGAK